MNQADLLIAQAPIVACVKCGIDARSVAYGASLPRGLCGRCYENERRNGRLRKWDKRRVPQQFCKRGHPLVGKNVVVSVDKSHPRGKRLCVTCRSAARRPYDGGNARALRRYRMSPERYSEMLAMQGGGCAICGRKPGKGERLQIDHDHRCCVGEVTCGRCTRGLLCRQCNVALGAVADSADVLLAMINYVTNRCKAPLIEVIG